MVIFMDLIFTEYDEAMSSSGSTEVEAACRGLRTPGLVVSPGLPLHNPGSETVMGIVFYPVFLPVNF